MRKMISNNVITVKNGRVGTMVATGSFLRGTSPADSPTRYIKLVSGITKAGSNWELTGGPFDYPSFEDGSLNLVVISELGYNNYILRVGENLYGITNVSTPASFEGNITIHPENIQNNEHIEMGKTFKAFKLED